MSALSMQGLGIPSADDPMETDADRRGGQIEDIDIDLDLAGEQQHDVEDEYMSEGVTAFNEQALGITQQTGDAYNDDEMVDDGDLEGAVIGSTSLQDEDLQDAEEVVVAQADDDDDDEIIDLADDEPLPASEVADSPQYGETMTNKNFRGPNQGQQTLQPEPEHSVEHTQQGQSFNHHLNYRRDQVNTELSEEVFAHQDALSQPQKTNAQDTDLESNLDSRPDTQRRHKSPAPVTPNIAFQALSRDPNHASDESSQVYDEGPEEPNSGTGAPLAAELVRETSGQHKSPPASPDEYAQGQNDEPTDQGEDISKPTDYIHPVLVLYEGAELSLFRPADGFQDFLLEDDHLFSESITKLLAACRPVLGDDVHARELIIGVEDLDLEIGEFASDASATTISQLIDIYLQLQHHDKIEAPRDFRLRLFTRPSLSHRLNVLRDAVGEGKGLSEVRLPQDVREEETYTSQDQQGNYKNTGENDEASSPAKDGFQEQDPEDNGEMLNQSGSPIRLVTPTAEKRSGQPNTEVYAGHEMTSEPASGGLELGRKIGQASDPKIDNQVGGQTDFVDFEARRANSSLQRDTQLQKTKGLATNNGEEDVIDYELEEAVGSKSSSSGSSTLHGDIDTTADQSLPSSDQLVTTREETLPETETSSHTLEGSINVLTTYALCTNDEEDDWYGAVDGQEEKAEAHAGEVDEMVEVEEAKAVEQEGRSPFADKADHPVGAEEDAGDESQDYDEIVNQSGYETSFEDHRGTVHQVEERQLPEYDSKALQPKNFEASQREDCVADSTKLDTQAIHGQIGADTHPGGDNTLAEQDYADAGNLEDFPKDPGAAPLEEEPSEEVEGSNLVGGHHTIHPTVPAGEEDEITYEDEEEIKLSNVEQDEVPSPGSLKKRPRSHSDADDFTAEDLQDAKRARST